MRGPLVALLICIATATRAAEPTFPNKAYITADDIEVRSGPGENYYATDKLKAGAEVEVYRHDPGGWYAIRPPKESFSWVSSRHLQLDGNNVATVTDDRVAARVGSHLNDTRDVIQVRLHKGEVVEVLEPRSNVPAGNQGVPAWYKIAPPAGEFRWVSGRFVDPDFEGARKTLAGETGDLSSQAPGRLPTDNREPPRSSPAQCQKQLDRMDLELSVMVVEDPNLWDLSELRQQAETLFNQSETALERGRARMLVSKISRFEDIKRRKQALAAVRPELALPDQLAISSRPLADPDGRFDAKGQLIRVPDPKPGGPQYAILDAKGNIRCYVSPAPGVNLRSYVGQQVGINGIRGYMPEQKAGHVMARHVSVVEGNVIK
ncbi:MAG: SH3 domain-containing protein [Planctomycetota bacterium]